MGLLKPEDRVARAGTVAGFACSLQMLNAPVGCLCILGQVNAWQFNVAGWIDLASSPLYFVTAFEFFCRFPADAALSRPWRIVRKLLLAYGVFLWLLKSPELVGCLFGSGASLRYAYPWAVFRNILVYGGMASFRTWNSLFGAATLAVVVRNYRILRSQDLKRRVRWVACAAGAGIAPFTIDQLTGGLLTRATHIPGATLIACTGVVPAAIVYSVLRHRVIGVGVAIHLGLQFLFARNFLRVVLALPLVVLGVTVVANPHRTIAEIFLENWFSVGLLVAAAIGLRFRKRLVEGLERRFFREAYSQERILTELVEEIKMLDSIAGIAPLVSAQIEAALHPERVYVFYRAAEESELTLGYSSGGMPSDPRIPAHFELPRFLRGARVPVDFPLRRGGDLPEAEAAWLAQLGVVLVVPIAGIEEAVVGVVLLGERKSEEPYSATDRRLLQAIGSQIAVVYENAWLKEKVNRERRIQRDVLARIQERPVNLMKECPVCHACYDQVLANCPSDGAELTLTLPVERAVDGKYRLDRLLGKGGMGAVYEATDLRLNRKIAVKVMMGRLFGNRAALRRFEREAQAAAGLRHANIVAIHDFGGIGSDGAYLVMELLRGTTWRAELKRGRFAPRTASARIAQLLEGVRAAHDAGVVHRDLKPENIFIDIEETVKVLDFGLAKVVRAEDPDSTGLTLAGQVMGTAGYMPPEQLAGGEVDLRADIFALGIIVAESLLGRRPEREFHVAGEPAAARLVEAIVARATAADPEDRYRSVAEFQAPLVEAVAQLGQAQSQAAGADAETRTL